MGTVIWILALVVVGIFNAMLAQRKGYASYGWFFAAGPIGYLVLAFLPDLTPVMGKEKPGAASTRALGNRIGYGISIFTIILVLGWWLSKDVQPVAAGM